MIVNDVYEPLESYRDNFREKFEEEAIAAFNDLLGRSGVDFALNQKTNAEITALLSKLETAKKHCGGYVAAIVIICLAIAASFAWGIAAIAGTNFDGGAASLAICGLIGTIFLLFRWALPHYRSCKTKKAAIESSIAMKKEEALKQTEPLVSLIEWNTIQNIIEKVVPRIRFDPYFTDERLNELREHFGWDDSFNNGKSVIFAQSGDINGNPFVFGDILEASMGTRVYTGSRTVFWTEMERGPDGKLRAVTKSDVLIAEVVKPCPEYSRDSFLLYGNDAAPTLSFSRTPSKLSSSGDGFFAKHALKREIKKLEKFSRNLNDDSNYTIMGNREFEALFHAVNRSDEQQFRLLFTPLAQTQMLLLLRDKEVGYGDDFSFIKSGGVNVIRPMHLDGSKLDTNPARFNDGNIKIIYSSFISFAKEYFKSTYFALAPLLAIPLYQQTKTHEEIYGLPKGRSSFWEHESLVNYLGANRFKHPESATSNILKTRVEKGDGYLSRLTVTAYSYKAVQRVAVVNKMARNGRVYAVNVPWIEFIPVQRTSQMLFSEIEGLTRSEFKQCMASPSEEWAEFFRSLGTAPGRARYRRQIIAG